MTTGRFFPLNSRCGGECFVLGMSERPKHAPPHLEFNGCRDFDITEIDITESDVTETDISENDLTGSDITESDITESDIT